MVALRQDLDAIFNAPLMAHAQWGVFVQSLDSGQVLYSRNADKLLMPASNVKILTLAAAAHTLGWDARFVTTLESAGTIEAGTLLGDLIVRGGGDPTINSRHGRARAVFGEWIRALRLRGINEIRGRIVGDDTAFEDVPLGTGWAWDDLQYWYSAPIGALQLNDSVVEMSVTPGPAVGEPGLIEIGPHGGLHVWNRTRTTASGIPPTLNFRRHLDRPFLEVTGTLPMQAEGAPPWQAALARQVAVVNPTLHFVESLRDALVAAGIRVTGDAVDLDDIAAARGPLPQRRVLARTESPPLWEMAVVLMKVSHNLYAETLLKASGEAAHGSATSERGRRAVLDALRAWKLDEHPVILADGSGLSRYNYASPALIAGVLRQMYLDPVHRDRFAAALPIAGTDGTVSGRLRGTRAEANATAKTGSLSSVRALSGYLRTAGGEMLVFSILGNNFAIPGATVNWIADLAVEVLANFRGDPARRPTEAPAPPPARH